MLNDRVYEALKKALGRQELSMEDAMRVNKDRETLNLSIKGVGQFREKLIDSYIGYDKDGILQSVSSENKKYALAFFNLVEEMRTDDGKKIMQSVATNNPRKEPFELVKGLQHDGYNILAPNMSTCGNATCHAMFKELISKNLKPTVRLANCTPELYRMATNAGLIVTEKEANGLIIGELAPPKVPDNKEIERIAKLSLITPIVMITNPDRQMPHKGKDGETKIVDCVGRTLVNIIMGLRPDAKIIGKPNFDFLNENLEQCLENFDRSRESIKKIYFIGDTLDTDTVFANDAKGKIQGIECYSVLMTSGNTSEKQAKDATGLKKADFVVPNFMEAISKVFGITRSREIEDKIIGKEKTTEPKFEM